MRRGDSRLVFSATSASSALILLSSLGERLGEGVMQETVFGLTPSPNLSPEGERNMRRGEGGAYRPRSIRQPFCRCRIGPQTWRVRIMCQRCGSLSGPAIGPASST
jgi:hypothetical protein